MQRCTGSSVSMPRKGWSRVAVRISSGWELRALLPRCVVRSSFSLDSCSHLTSQSSPAKLQLLTLSAKLLVLSHQSPLTPHLRPLSLLFDYLALLARYDLSYEVRDRARFLAGLVSSAGIGKSTEERDEAKVMLQEEEFRRGVTVEDLTGEGEKNGEKEEEGTQRLTGEQVKRVLFDGKQFGQEAGASSFLFALLTLIDFADTDYFARTDTSALSAQLGTFSLSLPTKRPFGSSSLSAVPPYATTAPPSSIRDPPAGKHSSTLASRSATPLQGFGSDSFASSPRPGSAASSRSNTRSAREKVVLVPTGSSSGFRQAEQPRRKVGMDEFLASEDEESSSEEEEEEESDDDEEDGSAEEQEAEENGAAEASSSGEEEESSGEEEVSSEEDEAEKSRRPL